MQTIAELTAELDDAIEAFGHSSQEGQLLLGAKELIDRLREALMIARMGLAGVLDSEDSVNIGNEIVLGVPVSWERYATNSKAEIDRWKEMTLK